ncbi:E3 ubiquitin-protein ligase RMA1H1-like [Rutidosis leptorrhynchoides]|uniref:E3 ubiquitin-protein ligase RMA1H1-like n=1 Tax=Rutidosis leptorrhynchoides TaxID=125765 RepID=UPI003A9A0AAD
MAMEYENNFYADELKPEKSLPCFDCSICLDYAKDPVVTLCGHLYCWPCIYKWLSFKTTSTESDNNNPLCPVCKSEISHTSVVPLYGRGKTLAENEPGTKSSNTVIPPRPHASLLSTQNPPRQFAYQNSRQTPYGSYNPNSGLYDQTSYGVGYNSNPGLYNQGVDDYNQNIRMYGEMIYARVFGNSQRLYTFPNSYHLAGSNNPRLRRQEMQIHRSLDRLNVFLFCCMFLCLLLF